MTAPASLPTGPAGRLLAVVLLGVVVALVWIAVAVPLLEWHAQRAEALERKGALLHRMAMVVARLPDWQRAREATAAQGPVRPVLLQGDTDGLAAAALQGIVQEMARRAGATIGSMEILAAEQRAPYRRIAMRVSLDSQWPILLNLLRGIGEATPRMLVDGLSIRGPDARMRSDTPPLATTFTVLAFRAVGPGERP